ncbi:unnamed protein product [Rotaria magnacalcarata]|uniref:Ciliogenesis-associated TTC17-interacting protein n=1 Tax=Rotaria magnacalcarata TaxID=392030 RepID=A0A816SW28_9BILA|nr:unnamed protein product [Rotaria magnacalcarata]CAF1584790.1 unnamed protein product [Rotaria magnacalcarata]CAF2093091.1 unnamed protein product [Rotaria magnacalcarata]CAF2126081.1 unnamed protein product [Rotaria magnacalcarata]CAF2193851.1 unnamed protein product [Rotaria magnacalcarata]
MVSAENSSLEYLRSLVNYDINSILYDDTLICSLTNNTDVGSFEVKVTKTNYGNLHDCIQVIANSQATIDGVACGTTVRAVVTRELVTVQQEHTEYVKLPNPITRIVDFISESTDYVITITNEEGKKKTTETKRIPKNEAQGLILEGANLILQRLMIQRNMPDKVTMLSLDSSSELSRNVYTSLGPQQVNINGKDIEAWGIQRQIFETKPNALPIAWQSFFSIDGHLISRYQVGSPIKMKTRNIPEAEQFDEYLPKPEIPKRELEWENDLELRSRFIDRRDELIDDYKSYIYQHPDINALLSDFLQSVLITKPENIIDYATEFFAPFNNQTADRSLFRFADEKIPVPKPNISLK